MKYFWGSLTISSLLGGYFLWREKKKSDQRKADRLAAIKSRY